MSPSRFFATTTAVLLLFISATLAYLATWNNSAIFDETAHIGAGYAYLTERDSHLNPEHPPLVKDIAALPLLFFNLSYPTDTDAWSTEVNGQWDQGGGFLFEFGNNPELILRSSRLPIVILSFLTGLFLFLWIRSVFGNKVAFLATFFFAFSPTVLAHSGFVTTDIAATLGFLVGTATFVRFLKQQTLRRFTVASLAFGIAQLLKFSLFLLVPIYIILAFVWLVVSEDLHPLKNWVRKTFLLYSRIGVLFVFGALIIWAVYAWHVWDYPQERQLRDAQVLIGEFRPHAFVSLDLWLISHRATRPLGQYLLGVMMVSQRTAGGNSAYFLGEVSSAGWTHYFPTLYFLKETLAFHILSVLALCIAIWRIARTRDKSRKAIREWLEDNFILFASIFFVVFYWTSSVTNPLNIGVRHVLPTFPFIYLLVSRELTLWISGSGPLVRNSLTATGYLQFFWARIIKSLPRVLFLILMMLWITASAFVNFPSYLSYYNELAGGTREGFWYATDSNYDWGQDLKRLSIKLSQDYPNERIYLHYFGGSTRDNGAQRFYLGEKFIPHYSSFGPPPRGSLFAVSVNELMGNWARPVNGFPPPKAEDAYLWLKNLKPIDRGGTSIFIYRIP
ncbi:MAG: hypothetical protein A3G60_01030 [Candidatus Ryanbacteria bacterium RIFCSPLOWO2_12_FULL_47_9c]|uniref:ArnT-like N-terminal domain-containing protein n=1 Tax=Candidatus Ryanbacteria bacterium RIFCSPLOWO2_12_FULL_47_9c TaxID=1802131 RepID=A0A1G2H4Z5_9BACT|nr:MAG: hypothetical protein A3G60_01030 [Candidatus Ryanbacteria bacterium RIFCSPLOWO2_12_FULL_47_9c]